jgi:hypothetical protein
MTVNVMLACGLPGPLTVHTPEVCYAGAGYEEDEDPVVHLASGARTVPEFWMCKFSKPEALVPAELRLFWSWRAAGGWKASDNPRLQFAGQPVLYKMYVSHVTTGIETRQDIAACHEFINLLVPELERVLTGQP